MRLMWRDVGESGNRRHVHDTRQRSATFHRVHCSVFWVRYVLMKRSCNSLSEGSISKYCARISALRSGHAATPATRASLYDRAAHPNVSQCSSDLNTHIRDPHLSVILWVCSGMVSPSRKLLPRSDCHLAIIPRRTVCSRMDSGRGGAWRGETRRKKHANPLPSGSIIDRLPAQRIWTLGKHYFWA